MPAHGDNVAVIGEGGWDGKGKGDGNRGDWDGIRTGIGGWGGMGFGVREVGMGWVWDGIWALGLGIGD